MFAFSIDPRRLSRVWLARATEYAFPRGTSNRSRGAPSFARISLRDCRVRRCSGSISPARRGPPHSSRGSQRSRITGRRSCRSRFDRGNSSVLAASPSRRNDRPPPIGSTSGERRRRARAVRCTGRNHVDRGKGFRGGSEERAPDGVPRGWEVNAAIGCTLVPYGLPCCPNRRITLRGQKLLSYHVGPATRTMAGSRRDRPDAKQAGHATCDLWNENVRQ